MRLAGHVGDDLHVEADAEGDGVGPVEGEEAVVVAAAVAEAAAVAGEGEAGDDDERDVGGGDDLGAGGGFAQERVPGGGREFGKIADGHKLQPVADHARIAVAVADVLPQRLDVGLARERGEEGDGFRVLKSGVRGKGGGNGAGFFSARGAERF